MNAFLAFDLAVFQHLQITTFLALAIAMIVGMLFTRVMKFLRLPNVTGYLIAGLLIGPSIGKIIDIDTLHSFSVITSLALGFIAFSIGGEFKLQHIKSLGAKVLVIATVQAVCASVFVLCALFIVQAISPSSAPTPMILVLAAIAAATAPAATLMVVKQYKAKGPLTNTLLPVVAFDDAIALIIFSICLALAKVFATGEQLTVLSAFVFPIIEIVLSLGIGTLFGFFLGFVCRFFHSRTNRLIWMIAMVVLSVALCELLELSSLLTCMMLGATFTNVRKDSVEILERSDLWTPPIFMLFFIISGADIDLKIIPLIGIVGLVYLFARSLGKYIGAWGSSKLMKAEPSVQKYLGITLLPQAGVAIGMAQTVSQMPELAEFSNRIVTVVLCATLIYELLGPILTKMALMKAGEITEAGDSIFKEISKKFKGKKLVKDTVGADVSFIENASDVENKNTEGKN